MNTARERFFPAAVASSGSALHRSSSVGRSRGQTSSILSALDNAGLNRPPTQMGFSSFMAKPAGNAQTLGSAESIVRPGTAAPREGEERGLNVGVERNIPVIAPTPKKLHRIMPPFAFRNGSFNSESADASADNHALNSPDNRTEGNDEIGHSAIERRDESFKIPFPKKTNAQRVPAQPEPSQYQLPRRRQPSPNQNDQNGSNVSSLQRNKKRMRESDDVEDTEFIERNVKRFRVHEREEDDKMSQYGSHPERPSSTASSAMGSYHGHPDAAVVNTPPARHSQFGRQENLDMNPTIPANRTHVGLPRRRSEPVGLDKLLGPGSNDLIDQYADKYEALLKKWSECSVAEWKAGADEISARFTMMLNFAKDHLDKKLKTYSGLNAILDSHCEILRERSEAMELSKQQLVKEARNVLG